jgi:hypothetical protein
MCCIEFGIDLLDFVKEKRGEGSCFFRYSANGEENPKKGQNHISVFNRALQDRL